MPTCAAPCAPKPKECLPCEYPDKYLNNLFEPEFPESLAKWNQSICPPCKGVYTWVSSPKAIYNTKKMIKDQPPEPPKPPRSNNIMYDKRVHRGSNYTQPMILSWNPNFAYAGLLSGKGEGDCCVREAEARRRQVLRQKCATRNRRGIIGTPPPVKGRKHERVQTELYLEELFERPPELDAACQTDLFLHRPPTPPYVPAKIGVDVETEILEGELFDFDTEVQPLLEVLVGKSVEQGLMEVMHEEEVADMKEQQQQYLAIREAEMAELKRLEAEEQRLQAEKERRNKQEEIARELDREMEERVTAAKLLQGHINTLMPGVLNTIEPFLEAENREALERTLGPWLASEVAQEVGQIIDSRELLEEIVSDILRDRACRYMKMAQSASIASTQEEETDHEEEGQYEAAFEDYGHELE